jgi:hypothetical protein
MPMPQAIEDKDFTFSMYAVLLNNAQFLQNMMDREHTQGLHDVEKMRGMGAVGGSIYHATSGQSSVWGYFGGVTNPSTGVYRFTFSPVLPSAEYIAISNVWTQNNNRRSVITTRTAVYTEVSIYDDSDALVNLASADACQVIAWQNA